MVHERETGIFFASRERCACISHSYISIVQRSAGLSVLRIRGLKIESEYAPILWVPRSVNRHERRRVRIRGILSEKNLTFREKLFAIMLVCASRIVLSRTIEDAASQCFFFFIILQWKEKHKDSGRGQICISTLIKSAYSIKGLKEPYNSQGPIRVWGKKGPIIISSKMV